MRLAPEVISSMQQLAVEQRRRLGARAPWHVGDIAWQTRQHEGREDEWKIRLWIEDGRTVAWSWLKQDGRDRLELDINPDYLHLLDELLAEPRARSAFAFEDDPERREALVRHGFVETKTGSRHLVLELPESPSLPELPEGFSYRNASQADIAERVAIHRDVWSLPGRPSRVTESSYAQVRAQWPYRESLDCVIEAPDGRFAAYCLCWLDPENGVGEFEPVGVREDFRRLGLGSAVCKFALRQLNGEGGREAIVYCSGGGPAQALYESVGFRVHATVIEHARPEDV